MAHRIASLAMNRRKTRRMTPAIIAMTVLFMTTENRRSIVRESVAMPNN